MQKRSEKAGMQRAAAHAAGYVTGVDAAKIVGISYRRVDHAARIGVAPPAIKPAGSGTARGYDLEALVRLKVAATLFDLGVTTRDNPELPEWLDRIDYGGGATSLRTGCVTLLVDPQHARRQVEDAYRAMLGGEVRG